MSSHRLTFRPMQEGDLSTVMEIELRAYPHPWSEGIMRDCLRSGHHCWLTLYGNRIIGHAVMTIAADESHLLNIVIDPKCHGHGYGRILLKHMLGLAQQKNVGTVFLEVRDSNRVAATLYDSVGFNEVGRRRGYYPATKGREDAIVYGLIL